MRATNITRGHPLWWRWILYGTALSVVHLLAFVTCIAFDCPHFLIRMLGMPFIWVDEFSRHASTLLPGAAYTWYRNWQEVAGPLGFFGNSLVWGFALAAIALFWIQQRRGSLTNHESDPAS